jgi:hypothetical protein
VGPKAGLDAVANRLNLPLQESNPGRQSRSVSLYKVLKHLILITSRQYYRKEIKEYL